MWCCGLANNKKGPEVVTDIDNHFNIYGQNKDLIIMQKDKRIQELEEAHLDLSQKLDALEVVSNN